MQVRIKNSHFSRIFSVIEGTSATAQNCPTGGAVIRKLRTTARPAQNSDFFSLKSAVGEHVEPYRGKNTLQKRFKMIKKHSFSTAGETP